MEHSVCVFPTDIYVHLVFSAQLLFIRSFFNVCPRYAFFLKYLLLQSLQGRDVPSGVATHVFSRMMKRLRGRAPGKRAEPEAVAHTGSIVLMPGKHRGKSFSHFQEDCLYKLFHSKYLTK